MVILDDETMEDLKSQIRKEVMKDIEKSGLYLEEVERYLHSCRFDTYADLLSKTLDGVIDRIDSSSIYFYCNRRKFQKLKAIKSVWDL